MLLLTCKTEVGCLLPSYFSAKQCLDRDRDRANSQVNVVVKKSLEKTFNKRAWRIWIRSSYSPWKYSTARYVSKLHLHLGKKPIQGLTEQPVRAFHHQSPALSLKMCGNNSTLLPPLQWGDSQSCYTAKKEVWLANSKPAYANLCLWEIDMRNRLNMPLLGKTLIIRGK